MVFRKLDKASLGRRLCATDVAYFEAAAENSQCLGGVLSLTPGFPDLALACVLHSLTNIDDIENWIQELETVVPATGSRWLRFYLQKVSDRQRAFFLKKDYRESVELGFVIRLGIQAFGGMELKVCHGEADWQQYTQLCVISDQSPDGFDMDDDSYVQVSRLKVDAGYMTPYLAVLHDRVVGFVNIQLQGDFARCKNLLVHPDHRNQGVGTTIVKTAMMTAREQGAQYFGCYAIVGEPSVYLYRGLGMVEVTRQYEWSKHLGIT